MRPQDKAQVSTLNLCKLQTFICTENNLRLNSIDCFEYGADLKYVFVDCIYYNGAVTNFESVYTTTRLGYNQHVKALVQGILNHADRFRNVIQVYDRQFRHQLSVHDIYQRLRVASTYKQQ